VCHIYKKISSAKYFSFVSFATAIYNRVLFMNASSPHWVLYSVFRSMRQEVTGNCRIIIMKSFKISTRRKISLGLSNQRQHWTGIWQNMKNEKFTEALFGTHDGKRQLGKCRLRLKDKTTIISKKMGICQLISLK